MTHLFQGAFCSDLQESARLAPLLDPPLKFSGELWELSPDITPHTAALRKDACLERECRLLTRTTQKGMKEEEEKKKETHQVLVHPSLSPSEESLLLLLVDSG